MGMQVHFKLSDVLERSAIVLTLTRYDELLDFSGSIITEGCNSGINFNIVPNGNLPSDDCWADVVYDRAIVNWLIDQRVPFNAS